MHKYRILAIPQFARISGLTYKHAAEVLLDLERRGIIGYLGYTSIPGHGKTPKIYFLTRRDFTYLVNETALSSEEVKAFREVSSELAWMPQMYHRLRILDCFIALELTVRDRGYLELADTRLEYRRRKPSQEIGRVMVGEAGHGGDLGDGQEAVALDVEEPEDGARGDD